MSGKYTLIEVTRLIELESRIKVLEAERDRLKAENERILLDKERGFDIEEFDRRRNLLEDVVNELELSEYAIEKHGPLGTEPAVLVGLVLKEKDRQISQLRARLEGLEAELGVWENREKFWDDKTTALEAERDRQKRYILQLEANEKEAVKCISTRRPAGAGRCGK